MAKVIVFSTDVDAEIAKKFDALAEKNFRSRAQHLNFLVEQAVEKDNE